MRIRNSGSLAVMLMIYLTSVSQTIDTSHKVSLNKSLSKAFIQSLYNNGNLIYTGEELQTIGMPCGGIGAGQLCVRGDGTLGDWWISNNAYNTGQGAEHYWNFPTALGDWKTGYQTYTPTSYIDQGFDIVITSSHSTLTNKLDRSGFDDIRFTGEYPVATIDYKSKNEKLPVDLSLKVFSPFIPLNAKESATPGTVLQYTLKNNSNEKLTVAINGWLQNLVGLNMRDKVTGTSCNKVVKEKGMVSVVMCLNNTSLPADHPYNGEIALTVLSNDAIGYADKTGAKKNNVSAERSLGQPLVGSIYNSISLKPGESKQITFLITWYFPNRPKAYNGSSWNQPMNTKGAAIGNNYANWFDSSLDVAKWLSQNLPRLQKQTFDFVNAYYHNSTLPYWLTRRAMMPVSTLATETCQWWSNGKFWAWEGVGSCAGTCTHVWNYEQGMAYLFPELERNVREQTDFSTSFHADGMIDMRNGGGGWAVDGQAGTVLKAYREHLQSSNNLFLSRNWDKIRKATEYLIAQDSDRNGLIEKGQPNTYDVAFHGANTFVGSLYLASLKAASRMAAIMRDTAFSITCDSIFRFGSKETVKRLWNGNYFVQEVDLQQHKYSQYGQGCLSDQLFGQTWSDLTGLGYLYPKENVRTTLQSIWKYNWAPDIAAQTAAHKPERPFANPGEAGLFVCTWPFSPHLGEHGVRYADEIWTGIEYQVATAMIYEDMLDEGLSIIKAIDDRYNGAKHNPYNEFECGEHYTRAMASYGILPAIEGYYYDGPAGILGFAPRLHPEKFKGFFTAAEGWGNIMQSRKDREQIDSISVAYGLVTLRCLHFETLSEPKNVSIKLNGVTIPSQFSYDNGKLNIVFDQAIVEAGQQLIAKITF